MQRRMMFSTAVFLSVAIGCEYVMHECNYCKTLYFSCIL